MKHIFIFSLLLVMCFLSVTFADEEPENSRRSREEKQARQQELHQKRTQARELAREVLDGRQVVVRVYNNWQKDVRAFERVTVQLKELSVGLDAVESAFGEMSESAVIVVTAEDQKDEAVAAVVGDFIYAEPYKKGKSFSIWPEHIGDIADKWHVFKDALGNPIPHAAVEIMIGQYAAFWNKGPRVSIRKTKLNDKGRLRTFKSTSTLNKPSFMVWHPDYGSDPIPAGPYIRLDEPVWTNFVPVLPKDKWCIFKDALGNPIPEATVEIFKGSNWEKRKPDSIGNIKLDEKGRLRPPELNPRLRLCCFIVSHPDYGTALVEPNRRRHPSEPLFSCTVPLVRIDTKADERSIWGTVVDPNGKPVAGAMLTCMGVSVPSGGRISASYYQPWKTITDEQGHFALYLPIEKDSEKHGSLVPLASKYSIRIEAPKDLGLESYSGKINSGEETTITMVPVGHGGYFHSFVFEDANGPITDPNKLNKIRLTIKGENRTQVFRYEDWKKGGKFPPGTYKVLIPGEKPLIFEPIQVTTDSPEQLVFKVPPGIIYYGQVVHGISGAPMPGAIVMSVEDGFGNDVSLLEPNQWDAICSVGPELDPQEPALAPLKEAFKFKKITQTDPKGSFEISFRPGEIGGCLVAVKKDYLGAAQKLSYFMPTDETKTKTSEFEAVEPDGDGCITLPEMKLFPAGTIVIEPNVPTEAEEAGHDEVRLHWFTDPDDNTFWLSDLWATPKNNKGGYLFYKYDLRSNEIETAYIPAGLELTMRVYMMGESRWGPIIIDGIKLEQGQVLDLGRQDFQPAIRVSLKVIDSANEPVESVSVRINNNVSPWLIFMQGPITNENGIVRFRVPTYSSGEFVIEYYEDAKDSKSMHLRESVAYEIGGEEDAGREFTMTISDEMLYQLFK